MKNFEVRCATDGTSALQPEFDYAPMSTGAIIEFPGRASRRALAYPERDAIRDVSARAASTSRYAEAARTAHAFRFGSIGGCAYGRVRPWQAAIAGCVFSALALVSMFVGL